MVAVVVVVEHQRLLEQVGATEEMEWGLVLAVAVAGLYLPQQGLAAMAGQALRAWS